MSERAPLGLKLAAGAGLAFIHIPLAFIVLYAFTSEDRSYQFPPPGYTLKWFGVAWGRQDVFDALSLSVSIAALSTIVAAYLPGAGVRSFPPRTSLDVEDIDVWQPWVGRGPHAG